MSSLPPYSLFCACVPPSRGIKKSSSHPFIHNNPSSPLLHLSLPFSPSSMSYAVPTPLISAFAPPPAAALLNPPLKISTPTITVEATQSTNPKDAAPTSTRAALQTLPRQKRSFERKTARAMKPAKWKRVVRDSMAKAA